MSKIFNDYTLELLKQPIDLSLSNVPNYLIIKGGLASEPELTPLTIQYIKPYDGALDVETKSILRFKFVGTDTEIGYIFASNNAGKYENAFDITGDLPSGIRAAIMSIDYIRNNFDVDISITLDVTGITLTPTVTLTPKKGFKEYNVTMTADTAGYYALSGVGEIGIYEYDYISETDETAEILLEIYEGMPHIYGRQSAPPSNRETTGQLLAQIQKTYFGGEALIFDVNSIFKGVPFYTAPFDKFATEIQDGTYLPGTEKNIRVYAYVMRNGSPKLLYMSDIMHVINGFDSIDTTAQLYKEKFAVNTIDREKKQFVTDTPDGIFVHPEQNFTLTCAIENVGDLGIGQGLSLKGNIYGHDNYYIGSPDINVSGHYPNALRTVILNIQRFCESYAPISDVKFIEFILIMGNADVTRPLRVYVRDAQTHTRNEFFFLNRLGGWDAFNFDKVSTLDIKNDVTTFTPTVLPKESDLWQVSKREQFESVLKSEVKQEFTAVSAPVKKDVAEWLINLCASPAVYDREGMHVIINDYSSTIDPDNNNLQTVTIKYRYTNIWQQ